ncbi:hypothetical protein GCM10022221_67980 [Actinocorallia aurea]
MLNTPATITATGALFRPVDVALSVAAAFPGKVAISPAAYARHVAWTAADTARTESHQDAEQRLWSLLVEARMAYDQAVKHSIAGFKMPSVDPQGVRNSVGEVVPAEQVLFLEADTDADGRPVFRISTPDD